MSTLSATPGASTSSSHLSYITHAPRETSPSPPPAVPARELSKNRLYVGNLHPSVDEYAFLQVFAKFGKIAKLDFLFHKTGPSRGKPRGYAFVEYNDKENALKALLNAHNKLFRGRKLVVTYANQAPTYDTSFAGPGKHHRRGEVQRPTALSLIKSTSQPGKMEDKIAALEAKLRQMDEASKQASLQTPSLPAHPSLPLKPPPSLSEPALPSTSKTSIRKSSGAPSTSRRPPNAKSGGIFSSGSSSGLGKKPTLEELMKSKKTGALGGLLKR